ncbi:dihydroorotate dehydrogenase [Roseovarius sp. SCSIO 43702]|uniref:dihydroorotate dehydrogenase n=1 Tax=Roseovarius sp. SCSIO 43702 TaxID=2823043 RepID=UPI001C73B672|nr:dihydroorotate dehydrogenase [Roseovarius sp. SCSIO 43702]QYX57920.1 dihydroorotate dehydrogenase [Roseovarius sp. SCSIO 43702]
MSEHDTEKRHEAAGLDPFFAAARERSERPDAALRGRVMADAMREMETRRPLSRRAWERLRAIAAAMGGAPAFATLTLAAIAGVWVGLAQPGGADAVAALLGYGDTDGLTLEIGAGDAFANLEGAF